MLVYAQGLTLWWWATTILFWGYICSIFEAELIEFRDLFRVSIANLEWIYAIFLALMRHLGHYWRIVIQFDVVSRLNTVSQLTNIPQVVVIVLVLLYFYITALLLTAAYRLLISGFLGPEEVAVTIVDVVAVVALAFGVGCTLALLGGAVGELVGSRSVGQGQSLVTAADKLVTDPQLFDTIPCLSCLSWCIDDNLIVSRSLY